LTGEQLGFWHQPQEFTTEPNSPFIISYLRFIVDPNEPNQPKAALALQILFAAVRPPAASIR
jgi:hypothetical protein